MTPGDMERRMEFLVEQPAQFAAHIGELHESQATLTATVIRMAELMEENEKRTEERFRRTDERIAELAEAQNATDAQRRRTDEQLKETGERLNALIGFSEGHIPEPPPRG